MIWFQTTIFLLLVFLSVSLLFVFMSFVEEIITRLKSAYDFIQKENRGARYQLKEIAGSMPGFILATIFSGLFLTLLSYQLDIIFDVYHPIIQAIKAL